MSQKGQYRKPRQVLNKEGVPKIVESPQRSRRSRAHSRLASDGPKSIRNAVEATGWEQGGRDGGGSVGLEKLGGLVSLRRGFYKGGQHIVEIGDLR